MVKTFLVSSALVAVGLVGGMGLERILASDSAAGKPQADVSAGSGTSLARFQPLHATSSPLDSSQMRAMLREELAAALTSALANATGNGRSVPGPAVTQVSTPVVTTSPQQQQEAIQIASDILAAGQWGDVERMTFHQQLAQLDPVQREQAMQRLVQAIDNGSLKVSTVGPPL